MKRHINEKKLCVLKNNTNTNKIELSYVHLINPLSEELLKLKGICEDSKTTLEQVVQYIKTTVAFDQLSASYRYCESLDGSYQGFTANNQDKIVEITNKIQLIKLNEKENPETYNAEEEISHYKNKIKDKYHLWTQAYSINKAYRICNEDKSTIAFSHRIDGWSKPLYQLTPNFSLEIKTNFGFGRASYFYTILKFKNLEITPFSEWIDYEFAEFSEIIRYTQSYLLKNEYWLEAMEYTKDACNLSTTNENKFVEKYIIDECEKMVKGLEEIFKIEQFTFKKRGKEKEEEEAKKEGHALIEFRGEKISGSLEFISKILEFDKIVSMQSYINRIEILNNKIQPILDQESEIVKIKLSNLQAEISKLKPTYDKVIKQNTLHNKQKYNLQKKMISNGKLDPGNIDQDLLKDQFKKENPEYSDFEKEFESVTDRYKILNQQISTLTKTYDNITSYKENISNYFIK